MTKPDDDLVSIEGVIASTHRLPGRPVRLSREALESARTSLLAGGVPTLVEHDSRRPVQSRVTAVEVREEADGEYSLVVTMSMPRSEYEKFGARTAFSVAFPEDGIPGWPSPDYPDVVMLVDSYHWGDADILEALESFTDADFPVGGGRYHQFAGEPPAKIVFELFTNYKDIPPAVLAAYIVEAVKVLLVRRRKTRPAQQALEDTAASVPAADSAEAKAVQMEQSAAELPSQAQPEITTPDEDSGDSADLPAAKVVLEFRSGVRRATIDCDASDSSARLLETVIRTLADVTPISEEQDDPPPVQEV